MPCMGTNAIVNASINGMISGITSEASGGDFMDGALSGVFVYLYNEIADDIAFNRDGTHNDPVVEENIKRTKQELRQEVVVGLKRTNTIATAGGIAAAVEGDSFWSIVWDVTAFATDSLLTYLGEQSITSMLIDAGVDMISPSGADGKAAGTILKQGSRLV